MHKPHEGSVLDLAWTSFQKACPAQAEAASARSGMEAQIRCLADGPSSPRQAHVAATIPLVAACLLSRDSLMGEIRILHAQLNEHRDILKEAKVHDSWSVAVKHTPDLQGEVAKVVPAMECASDNWVTGHLPMKSELIDALIWSQKEQNELLPALGLLQKWKRRCVQEVNHAQSLHEAGFKAVRQCSSFKDDRSGCGNIQNKFLQASFKMKACSEACTADAAGQETAICKMITALCARKLALEEPTLQKICLPETAGNTVIK